MASQKYLDNTGLSYLASKIARKDLSNVDPATGRQRLSVSSTAEMQAYAAKIDLSNVTPSTGRTNLGITAITAAQVDEICGGEVVNAEEVEF